MTSNSPTFVTTYVYQPLELRQIRVLKCTRRDASDDTSGFEYNIVLIHVPERDPAPDFEAVSYTWGDAARVSALPIQNSTGHIALTANLTEALPFISKQSITGLLWIDQLCINQSDNVEKGVQVGLMSEIYSKAKRVVVWLGMEDENIKLCKQWFVELNDLLSKRPDANRTQRSSADYHTAWRYLAVRRSVEGAEWAKKYLAALTSVWLRLYFTRGWIVQEFILACELAILVGNISFDLFELEDIYHASQTYGKHCQGFRQLMQLKSYPYSGPQPLSFFRQLTSTSRGFDTRFYEDTLFSMTGMLKGLKFQPDYEQPIKTNFARFAAAVAEQFQSLDFLGLCSALIDKLAESRPADLQDFPSWVPSWSSRPLTSPFRMVAGGSDSVMSDVSWNASAGRKHAQSQPSDPSATLKLHVRGKVIDYVQSISPTVIGIAEDYEIGPTHLETVVERLKNDIPSHCGTWAPLDFVHFMNGLKCNGNEIQPFETAEAILQHPETRYVTAELNNKSNSDQILGLILAMGRGRRFAVTEKGKLGLVPMFGSQAAGATEKGSSIVILHGCIVPVVLECVDEMRKEYKVHGEAYVEEYMLGKAVDWEESGADEFILV